MIDFRYHIVSLVAVLLALALGIAVGTSALNGPIYHDLKHHVDQLLSETSNLHAQVRQLDNRIGADNDFVTAVEPTLIAGQLKGARVVVLSTPHADNDTRAALLTDLVAAGATVTADVRLRGTYTDPGQLDLLGQVADRLAPIDEPLPTGSASQRAADILAGALVGKSATHDIDSVLSGFHTAGILDVKGPAQPGHLALVVTGATEKASQSIVDLAGALHDVGAATVVAGPRQGDAASPLIAEVRSASGDNKVSTVDDADLAMGHVAVILALREQVSGGNGQYGVGPGASSPAPALATR